MSCTTIGIGLTAVCLAGVLIAEHRGAPQYQWVLKPLASCGFLITALGSSALVSAYGIAILVGLGCSFLGDVLLIPRSQRLFRLGVFSFLAGHLGFTVAFAIGGLDLRWMGCAALIGVAIAVLVWRWLSPHLDDEMRGSVIAYIGVITLMLSAAAGALGGSLPWWVSGGALAFYLSDLAVARQRFVTPSFINRLWGLPLYYAAQHVFALSSGAI